VEWNGIEEYRNTAEVSRARNLLTHTRCTGQQRAGIQRACHFSPALSRLGPAGLVSVALL